MSVGAVGRTGCPRARAGRRWWLCRRRAGAADFADVAQRGRDDLDRQRGTDLGCGDVSVYQAADGVTAEAFASSTRGNSASPAAPARSRSQDCTRRGLSSRRGDPLPTALTGATNVSAGDVAALASGTRRPPIDAPADASKPARRRSGHRGRGPSAGTGEPALGLCEDPGRVPAAGLRRIHVDGRCDPPPAAWGVHCQEDVQAPPGEFVTRSGTTLVERAPACARSPVMITQPWMSHPATCPRPAVAPSSEPPRRTHRLHRARRHRQQRPAWQANAPQHAAASCQGSPPVVRRPPTARRTRPTRRPRNQAVARRLLLRGQHVPVFDLHRGASSQVRYCRGCFVYPAGGTTHSCSLDHLTGPVNVCHARTTQSSPGGGG